MGSSGVALLRKTSSILSNSSISLPTLLTLGFVVSDNLWGGEVFWGLGLCD